MRRRTVLALALAACALFGFAGSKAFQAAAQREQLDTLRTHATQLDLELAQLRRAREALVRNLAQAQQQLAALPAPPPADASVPAGRRTEMHQWLARVKQLQRLFANRPEQRIPEMQLLGDEDWLRVAKHAALDSDDGAREALAKIRSAAISRFLTQLTPALKQFAAQSDALAEPPIFALGSHLSPGVDARLLDRYELKRTTNARGDVEWIVQNKSPIDADHDSQHQIKAASDGRSHGTSSLFAPAAWIPDFRERFQRAAQAYREANKNSPPVQPGMAHAFPYFDPPLDAATIEKLLKAEERMR